MAAKETPAIRWAKKRAGFIAKSDECAHHEALALVAEALGYSNWFELINASEEHRQERIAEFNSDKA